MLFIVVFIEVDMGIERMYSKSALKMDFRGENCMWVGDEEQQI